MACGTCVYIYRYLVSKLRRLEKETHLLQRTLAEDPMNEELTMEMDDLERQVSRQFRCGRSKVYILLISLFSKYECPDWKPRKLALDLDTYVPYMPLTPDLITRIVFFFIK
jgi:hypothetical protein